MLASFILFALAAIANAHSVMQQVILDGKAQGAHTGIRIPKSNSPVTLSQLNSNNIVCNANLASTSKVFSVSGGTKVGLEWRHTINTALNSDVISKSHRGPIQVYLAKVADATQSSVSGLKWFKIAEKGYDASSNTWATDTLIKNNGVFDVTIPSCIEAGNYIMRTDLIALHNADKASGAQFYIGCTQLKVSGTSGTANPSTVSFPGAYKQDDPGLKFNIYKKFSSYPIPGPSTFSCSGSNAAANAASTTKASTKTTTTKASSKTTTTKTSKAKSTVTLTKTATATVTARSIAKRDTTQCRSKRGHA